MINTNHTTTMSVDLPQFSLTNTDLKEDPRIAALRTSHPDYANLAEEWNFFITAYEGGKKSVSEAALFKHQREHAEDYQDRVIRAHPRNYCGPLVDFFTNFIYSEVIDRSAGSGDETAYGEFLKDVNLRGDDITAFMSEVSDDSQIFGMAYVIVDKPIKSVEVLSKADEKVAGVRPYWVLVKPAEIVDWEVDKFGKFSYAKRKQLLLRGHGTDRSKVERYTEYAVDTITVSEIDVTDPGEPVVTGVFLADHPTPGVVPIEVIRYKRLKTNLHIGMSFLTDLAYNNREINNLTSLLQEFLYRQAFNQLALEVDDNVAMQDQTDGNMGTSNSIEVPRGAKFPQYISPPVAPAEFILKERERHASDMYKRAAQDLMTEMSNGESSSGFSQAQSFSKTVPFISTRAEGLESLEQRLMMLTARAMGSVWAGRIKYKDRYELTNVSDLLTQLSMVFKDILMPSETFVKEELKRVVRELDGKLPEDVRAKIYKEIDGMDYAEWKKAAQSKPQPQDKPPSAAAQNMPKGMTTMAEVQKEAQVNAGGAANKTRSSKSGG